MKFVQNFTPPDFQVKNFTPPISPNFNSFSKKKHKKLVKMEKFTPLATNFTLPPGLTGWTNSTSVRVLMYFFPNYSPSPGRVRSPAGKSGSQKTKSNFVCQIYIFFCCWNICAQTKILSCWVQNLAFVYQRA